MGTSFSCPRVSKSQAKMEPWNGSLSLKMCTYSVVCPSTSSPKWQGCQQGHCLTDFIPCFSSSQAIDIRQGEHNSVSATDHIPCGRKSQHRAATELHGKGSYLTHEFASCSMGRESHTSEITSSYHRNRKHFCVRWCSPTGGPSSILELSYQAPGSKEAA